MILNINKEEKPQNDFIVCWEKFKQRPNKVTLYTSFSLDKFKEFLDKYSAKNFSINREEYFTQEQPLINQSHLKEINDSCYIAFTEFDIEFKEESIVGEVVIYYKTIGDPLVNAILVDLNKLSNNEETEDNKEEKKQQSFILNFYNGGYEMQEYTPLNCDEKNFELYYNDETLKSGKKWIKKLKNKNKGLTIIFGERGVGKSTFIQHKLKSIDKNNLFIPSTFFDNTINNPEFRNFLNKFRNNILILDDSEIFFSEIYSKSNIFTNNILQFVDGMDSEQLSLHIVLILNVEDINDIDHRLMEANNLCDVIEMKKLDVIKSKRLIKHLDINKKITEEYKLRDLINKPVYKENQKEIGFG